MATRPPIRLSFSAEPSTRSFAILSGMENMTRSMIAPIIPLQGIALLKTEAMTSGALFVGSLFAFLVLLSGGYLIRHFSRKVVFTASMAGVALSTFLLIADTAPTFILGAAFRVACAGLNILCMSLYVFDFIPKSKYGDAESKRVFWGALAWILGPIIGAYLYTEVDKSLPYWLTNIAVVVQLALFWHLRINDSDRINAPHIGSSIATPQRSIITVAARFFGRPELRKAYVIPFVRSLFWVSLFTYLPLYVASVDSIPDVWLGVLFASFQIGLMFSGAIKSISERLGLRRFIVSSFLFGTIFMVALALVPERNLLGIGLWFLAICAAVALDVAGNVPFLRLVPASERTEMTVVFSTWRDLSFALTPGVGFILLTLSNDNLAWVFWAQAIAFLAAGIYAWRLPHALDADATDD